MRRVVPHPTGKLACMRPVGRSFGCDARAVLVVFQKRTMHAMEMYLYPMS